MPERASESPIAVVGLGAVGGLLAGAAQQAGHEVVALTSPRRREQLADGGYAVRSPRFGEFRARPLVVQRLEAPCDPLFVCVKAYQLDEALHAIDVTRIGASTVVPLLNGLEHMALLRRTFEPSRVLAGSIGRIETKRAAFDLIEHTNSGGWIGLAGMHESRDVAQRLDTVASLLRSIGFDVDVVADEAKLLWRKLVRLAPLACLTAASGLTLDEIRREEPWRGRLERVVEETVAVANASGVPLSLDATLEVIAGLPGHISTSMARDVACGRESELDAIAGAVRRAAAAAGLGCPALDEMVETVEAIRGTA